MNRILILRLSIKQRAIMVFSSCFLIILFFLLGYYFAQNNHFILVDSSNKTTSVKSTAIQSGAAEPANCQTSEEYELLQKELTVLKSDFQLERKTQTLLKQQLAEKKAKVTQLKTEVSLYKGVINDSSDSAELYFQRISIKLADENEQKEFNKEKNGYLFKFSMTVAKNSKTKTQQQGRVQFTLFDQKNKQTDQWKLFDLKGIPIKKLHAQFQNLIIKEGLLMVEKQQPDSGKENKTLGKIKIAYIDSVKGDVDINHEFDLAIDKDISYVGK